MLTRLNLEVLRITNLGTFLTASLMSNERIAVTSPSFLIQALFRNRTNLKQSAEEILDSPFIGIGSIFTIHGAIL